MLTGKTLVNELVDELNVLKLPQMALALEDAYCNPSFLEKAQWREYNDSVCAFRSY